MNNANRHPRRHFITQMAAAGSALSLFPWLGAARAQNPKQRLILLFTPHGTIWESWRPTRGPSGAETDFTFSPILEPLASHREKVAIVEGLRLEHGAPYYVPHVFTMPALWTGSRIDTANTLFTHPDHIDKPFGWNTGVSVDQTIAAGLEDYGHYRSVTLGYKPSSAHPQSRMIYTAPGAPVTPVDGPQATFEELFGLIDPNTEQAAKDARRRKSVLDTVLADFNSRKGKLSATDKQRLEAHAASIRELEVLVASEAQGCERPSEPSGITDQTAMDRQLELLVTALACGITRVASYQLRVANIDSSLYPWAGIPDRGHHNRTHDQSAAIQAGLVELYRWYAGRVAHLLDLLATATDEDNVPLIENTLVIWGTEIGTGLSHDYKNVPFVFAGGAGVRLRGGRYLRFTASPQVRTNRMLVSALHAMGRTDIQTYGNLENGSGPIPGLLT